MSVSTYGTWLATGNIVAMLGLLESGFSGVITQKMSVAIANRENRKFLELAGANIATALFIAGLLFMSGLCLTPFIAEWINAEETTKTPITIAYIISLASASIAILVSLFSAFPQVWQDTKTVGVINTIVNAIAIGIMIFSLLLGAGVIALALGYVSRSLLNLLLQGKWIISKWNTLNLQKPIFKLSVIKYLLKLCLYPFLARMSNVVINNSQSFFIAVFMNPALATVYDITSKVCIAASGFISSANGSFFALFSLTIASKNKVVIDKVLKQVTAFYMTSLCSVVLYAVCFSQSVVYFWVGLDKYGGNILLVIICIAVFINQLKNYFNTLLYAGGLISKSSKIDILSLIVYLVILFFIIKSLQEYAIPIATIISSGLATIFYVCLLKIKMGLNIKQGLVVCFKSILIIIPFIITHYLIKMNLFSFLNLVIYSLTFSVLYLSILIYSNKNVVKMVYHKYFYTK
jgi:O-antigen/teichoic acid export membrane protein